jgi:hypothetical protein
MVIRNIRIVKCLLFLLLVSGSVQAQDVLPFPPALSGSVAGLTIQESTYKKRVEPKHLAEGAPNILIILMDDLGPGKPSTYGGKINTPTLSRVANQLISDIVLLDIVAFKQKWGLLGVGIGLIMPTASSDFLGTGKWSSGISGGCFEY